ncbi:class I SAM-dependent methyltransferase [Shewanella sp. LC6]|uniref:class I SAM-dependent DNA methyltransferase n=1 Tax=Gammaproteobacteria TaxID=1236 RepID=UPI0011296C64|nr:MULTISPECIES: class I SAM-dependent methyltransferase [unclassified Shewanella]MCG3759054.1 class I SAM-dependent methyltransferase [Vibrio cincinnatiensis]QQK61065.1 class I SAM-dependent methyltransferase [Shewanella sp. LC6]TPE50848.1 class I SAM-dependent methyltransferase [Shewanella sp. LC2]
MSNGLNQSLYEISDSYNEYGNRDISTIANRWDAKADLWDEQLRNAYSHLNQDGAYEQFILDAKALLETFNCKSVHLLEIGCGTALVAEALQKPSVTITGLDISEMMLKKAREKRILNASFHNADVFALPIAGIPKADLVLSRGILLSHYSKHDACIMFRAIRNCCKQKASVVMLDFLNVEASDPNHHRPGNKTYYHPNEIAEMARKAGFKSCRFTGTHKHRSRCTIITL